MYVVATIKSRSFISGSESANATEIPPRSPLQVRMEIVPNGIGRANQSKPTTPATLIHRADNAISIEATPASAKLQLKWITKTSRPINTKSTALRISSSSSQNLSTEVDPIIATANGRS